MAAYIGSLLVSTCGTVRQQTELANTYISLSELDFALYPLFSVSRSTEQVSALLRNQMSCCSQAPTKNENILFLYSLFLF